ncbi:isochorismatase family protein [Roseibium aestuarii]|uniref:Isochorismatase family protein n=1 Tax=Roseibium aestuarii TaxID=2600299 RepID=A0ABW4JY01_9HYPH|nr:isochorismatase family protein [Roseibium aestuarii]
MIWLLVAAPVVAVFLWLANGIRLIGRVSRGERIGERSGRALLLIDLQAVFWAGRAYSDASKARAQAAVLAEVAAARASGTPVIAVRQEWSIPSTRVLARLVMKGQAIAGTSGTDLAAPFKAAPDHILIKRVQDAFETGELDRLLASLNVGTLRICGLDACYCVARTAQAGLARGFQVELASEAILATDETARQKAFKQLAAEGATVL